MAESGGFSAGTLIERALALPPVRKTFRMASDWIDLQWSLNIAALHAIAPRAKGRLLDVGCGDKPYEAIFRPYVTEYIGIEHEATFAQTSADTHAVRPDLLYDGKRLPFDDKSFDTVLNVQVLEHTPEPGALVKEMSRVLKDDGRLILTAPFSFRLHEEPHDYFRYSPHGLGQLCKEAGLVIEHTETLGGLWSLMGHKLNTYLGLRVARIGGIAQAMGKLSHEGSEASRPRLWTLPWVAPTMAAVALGSRVLDSLLHDPQETLGFLIVARRDQLRSATTTA
jgi:SAM-dependent methyltransferase